MDANWRTIIWQQFGAAIDMLENGAIDLKEIEKWQAKRIEEEYNWDNVAEKYNSLFRGLLSSNNLAGVP